MPFEAEDLPTYGVTELAEMMNVSAYTIRSWAKTGTISCTLVRKEYRFSERDVRELLERSRIEHAGHEAVPA